MNPKEKFKNEEELEKYVLRMLEGVKADLQAGLAKDWGFCVDGSGGYCIFEVASEADLFASVRKYMPHLNFDVRQVLTIEQAIAARKAAAAQAGKQVS
jgi:hypothetical protein